MASSRDAREPRQSHGEGASGGALPSGDRQPFLSLRGIDKKFGRFHALRNIDLDVQDGEFVCFLGPSGCGKSTLLRIIAGLDQQSAGVVLQGGEDISRQSAAARRFGILFQSYALFPNLTVRDNVSYGLRDRTLSRADIDRRVAELLALVELSGTERKYPSQLSGGQQQRVALARAIAPSPRLLLLDEPLSALDAKVRVYLRGKIKDLQTRLGLTTIMVTHDQEEALTMADRVVVMNAGEIDQIGTPAAIYNQPSTRFVANFIGKMNFFDGVYTDHTILLGDTPFHAARGYPGGAGPVEICVRPEHILLTRDPPPAKEYVPATVRKREFLGAFWRYVVASDRLGGVETVVDMRGNEKPDAEAGIGDTVHLTFDPQHFHFLAVSGRPRETRTVGDA